MNKGSDSYSTEQTVSVIIPCYNAADTIVNTLCYLERQKYNNFEVVIVNDGSTDNLDETIKEYRSNSSITINYIKQDNYGLSVARNTGLNNAKGEYNFISALYQTLNPGLFYLVVIKW